MNKIIQLIKFKNKLEPKRRTGYFKNQIMDKCKSNPVFTKITTVLRPKQLITLLKLLLTFLLHCDVISQNNLVFDFTSIDCKSFRIPVDLVQLT